MKTNQVLIRKMGQFDVHQRTKDGYFNATVLLKQWNKYSGMKKELKDFFANKSTKEYIEVLKNEEIPNMGNSPYLKSRGNKGGTWMHPFLFIDFAMWLNPRFKLQVIRFVYDQLIKYRNEAGDAYRQMTSAIKKIVPASQLPTSIQSVAKALNYVVYNNHSTGIRNLKAEEHKAKELAELERDIAKFIDLGFITSYSQLMAHLRRLWKRKYAKTY